MAQQKITADQVDTLNQNTTGTASNVTGTVAVGNGGTGLTSPGTSGNVLTSNGTAWTSAAPSGGSASNTYKEAVRVATTANGALATAYENGDVLDGVTLVTGDRILIKNQTTASENGIYTVNASGAPTRATDFDTTGPEVANGAIIPVQFGTTNGGSTWQLITNGGTIGNNFVFMQLNGLGAANRSTWTPPIATNTNSFAIGSGSSATGSISIAIGNNSVSSNTQSIAIGTSASASGTATPMAIGDGATCSGTNGIAFGQSATASADRAIAIGRTSSNGGQRSCAIGFAAVNTSGYGTQILGTSCSTDSADRSGGIAIGNNSAIGSINSAIFGTNGRTDMAGEFSFAFGGFAAQGDARASIIIGRMTTTDATPLEIGVYGVSPGSGTTNTAPSQRIVLINDSSYIFDCDIVARNTATDAESAMYNLKFGIRRGTNAASTTLVGTPVVTVIGEDTGTTGWDVGVTADTTNGRPAITVTGEASKTIRWVANIRMTKVSG